MNAIASFLGKLWIYGFWEVASLEDVFIGVTQAILIPVGWY